MNRVAKITLASIGTIVILGVVAWLTLRPQPEGPRTVTIERTSVTQDVAFTGRLRAEVSSDLSFETVGTVDAIHVNTGDQVTTGQQLAHVNTAAASFELAQAQANLASGQEQEKLAWEKAEEELENLTSQNTRTVEAKRQAVRDTKAELDQRRKVHQQTAVEDGDQASTTQTALATLKIAETAYHAAQQSLAETKELTAKTTDSARAAADIAKAEYLATTQASGAVAGLSNLEASEALAQDKLTRKTITAPYDGIITAIAKEIGETATAGETVITIQTAGQLELAADVTETDAAKLREGMPATVTFDALPPQDQWTATIASISPAAQIVEGVPIYEVTLQIDNDQAFRPGLSANITVHADRKDNTIAVPRRAVATRGDTQSVTILNEDDSITDQTITTGLVGSDGSIEVTSGLSEGQHVIVDTASLDR